MNDYTKRDIEEAIKLARATSYSLIPTCFFEYNSFYSATTENLNGYIGRLFPKGKTCLTVNGSGDQALNLIYCGSNHVDCFDINILSGYFLPLKLECAKHLSYEEFLNFFSFKDYQTSFNYSVYQKVASGLDKNVAFFWEQLYQNFNYAGGDLRRSPLFIDGKIDREQFCMSNNYLQNEDAYLFLQKRLQSGVTVNFMATSLFDLPSALRSANSPKYDWILLSNVYDYLNPDIHVDFDTDRYLSFLRTELFPFLNPSGKIGVNYTFNYILQICLPKHYFPMKRKILSFLKKDIEYRGSVGFDSAKLGKIIIRSFDYLKNPSSKSRDALYVYSEEIVSKTRR